MIQAPSSDCRYYHGPYAEIYPISMDVCLNNSHHLIWLFHVFVRQVNLFYAFLETRGRGLFKVGKFCHR